MYAWNLRTVVAKQDDGCVVLSCSDGFDQPSLVDLVFTSSEEAARRGAVGTGEGKWAPWARGTAKG